MDGLWAWNELVRQAPVLGPEEASADGLLPPDEIRFALEYPAAPDLAAARDRILALADGREIFRLAPLFSEDGGDTGHFLALRIPGLGAGLSASFLYAVAADLTDAVGLVSCEPDVGARVFLEPDPDREHEAPAVESVVGDLLCWSQAAAPEGKDWALQAIKVPAAWTRAPKRGVGIRIGQPDTGVADHAELEPGALDFGRARNILEGGAPTDPLSDRMANPGHGTATSSVAVSRGTGEMSGSAPAATLVPIRCVNDVKIFNGTPIAAAVDHARAVGCAVITMSLGGIWSRSLAAAIRRAVAENVIVLAAAGNCVRFVTYPASDPNVIAVAGVDVNDAPWKGSCRGKAVTIAAPAENVYVARRRPGVADKTLVSGGQGTSFAVALTAGVAALWLAHHGRDAVVAEALKRGISVQELFRAALIATARTPARWNTALGAGIVDAEKLLQMTLAAIPGPAPRGGPGGVLETVAAAAADGAEVDGFNWTRHGAEASLLAARAAIRAQAMSEGVEALGTGWLAPSEALARKAPPMLRHLVWPDEDAATQPELASGVSAGMIRRLASGGPGLESGAELSESAAQSALASPEHRKMLLDRVFGVLDALPPAADPRVTRDRTDVRAAVEGALGKLATQGVAAELSGVERFSLEALVKLHGRPALPVLADNRIDPEDPRIGDWLILGDAAPFSSQLAAVGRIDLDGSHVGTGWVAAPGLIVTNRHVLEELAEEFRTASGTRWVFRRTPTINFASAGTGAATAFRLTDVVATGADRIDGRVVFRHLDFVVLAVESTNAAGTPLPQPLALLSDPAWSTAKTQVLLAGYPARPSSAALRDPVTGAPLRDVITRLTELYGYSFSRKYLSPGEIETAAGKVPGDSRNWVCAHDATTLGGSSGSWMLHLGDPGAVIGLHFGGGTLQANYAHSLAAVRAAGGPVADALAGANWLG